MTVINSSFGGGSGATCPNGHEVVPGASFCGQCGAAIDVKEEQTETSGVTTPSDSAPTVLDPDPAAADATEHLYTPAPTASAPPHHFPLETVAIITLGVLLVAVTAVMFVMLNSQSDELNSQSDKVSTLQRQVKAEAAALAVFSKSSPANFVRNLDSQLSALSANQQESYQWSYVDQRQSLSGQ